MLQVSSLSRCKNVSIIWDYPLRFALADYLSGHSIHSDYFVHFDGWYRYCLSLLGWRNTHLQRNHNARRNGLEDSVQWRSSTAQTFSGEDVRIGYTVHFDMSSQSRIILLAVQNHMSEWISKCTDVFPPGMFPLKAPWSIRSLWPDCNSLVYSAFW
jgi:hypothetical protein